MRGDERSDGRGDDRRDDRESGGKRNTTRQLCVDPRDKINAGNGSRVEKRPGMGQDEMGGARRRER